MKVFILAVNSGAFSLCLHNLFLSILYTAFCFVFSINTYFNYLIESFVIKNLQSVLFQEKFVLCYDR